MDTKYISVEKRGATAIVTITREDALNALSREVLDQLKASLDAAAADQEIRCIILTGKGKAFVAGADIAHMNGLSSGEAWEFAVYGQEICSYIENLSLPVIAAVNGYALGGGCELAMSCDIRLASEKARFGMPEASLGIIPGNGGTQRLPRLVGKGMAKYLIMTGKYIKAQEALQIGLIDKVTPPETLMQEALEISEMICSNSPDSITLIKQAVNNADEMTLEDGISCEAELYRRAFSTENRKIGMTAFLNKEKAVFR